MKDLFFLIEEKKLFLSEIKRKEKENKTKKSSKQDEKIIANLKQTKYNIYNSSEDNSVT